jgi:hypothetical protein
MQLKRRGVELRLIVGDHNRSTATVDLPLLKAVARSRRWFHEISTGKASSLAEIAAREGLAVRYVGRLINASNLRLVGGQRGFELSLPSAPTCGKPFGRFEKHSRPTRAIAIGRAHRPQQIG